MVQYIEEHKGESTVNFRPKRIIARVSGIGERDEDNITSSYERTKLRIELRELSKKNPIVRSAIERFQNLVVGAGDGIYPQIKTSDDSFNKVCMNYWFDWAELPDDQERYSMTDIQRLIITERFVCGEAFILLLRNGNVQIIEAGRIATPYEYEDDLRVKDGIRISKYGRKLGYYVCDRDAYGNIDRDGYRYINAQNMIHLTNNLRPDQLRGIPTLLPIMDLIKDHARLNNSIMRKAKKEAEQIFKLKVNSSDAVSGNIMDRMSGEIADEDTEIRDFKLEDGSINVLRNGEDLETIKNENPSSNYLDYDKRILDKISASLGLPTQLLMMDFHDSSWSSNRTAISMAYTVITDWQKSIINAMYRVWHWKIGKAVINEQLPPPPIDENGISEIFKVKFVCQEKILVDLRNEVNAIERLYGIGSLTLHDIADSRGVNWDEELIQKAKEHIHAIQLAEMVRKETGLENYSYQDLIATQVRAQESQLKNKKGENDE